MTLKDLEVGGSGVIVAVHGQGALRDRLLDMGLTPRTRVMIRKTAPMGDPIEISLRCYELTLRKEDADNIEIIRDGNPPTCKRLQRRNRRAFRGFGRNSRPEEFEV
ncbi:MAG: ferrous iron transport protein A [Clostridiaceae bacterium]|nr:ferrous iron transport protein A [Clostridiaceae bacterium]